ncbi:integrase/recombinase XerD [Salirhabdus euzebyi]|uniref:Integrase/recombinase XerD n=1 Tax=Salirhabdus euzebyi TaxID=394506 RepID=A0A841Q7Y0_9BACI|nr:tyrosine-type recombinase/integrase [Salirhabdus euzebyi]MBB6454392.1 integrase/recombinase XerD [Salirhabdus euzebyi]
MNTKRRIKRIRNKLKETDTCNSQQNGHNMGIEEGFSIFIQSKTNENLKERTISDHKKHFEYFTKYLYKFKPHIKRIKDISIQDINDYISYMKNAKRCWDDHCDLKNVSERIGLKSTTINIRLRTLKAQFRFWYRKGYITDDIAKEITLLKEDKVDFKAFKKEHIKRILAQIEFNSKYTEFRDYVLIYLLIDTGARINHLLSLKMENINFITRTFTLEADKSKIREDTVYSFTGRTGQWLKKLVEYNRSNLQITNGFVFMTIEGKQYKADTFRKRLKDYGKKANVPSDIKITPHSFRHFYATDAYEKGASLLELKSLLKHKCLEATMRYIHDDVDHYRKTHNQYSPVHNF